MINTTIQKSLFESLKDVGLFFGNEHELFLSKIKLIEVKKGAVLLKKGGVCSSIYFIATGSVVQSLKKEDRDIVVDLYLPNEWVIEQQSFTSRNPSQYTIEAFEDATLVVLTIESIHQLIAASPSFFKLGSYLDRSKHRLGFYDGAATPDEKVAALLENKPEVFQKFPLKVIASYLKITPETLSRVRKRSQFSKVAS